VKVLFLDDNEDRWRDFRARRIGWDLTYVRNHDEALTALDSQRWDEIWLDHDLSEMATLGIYGQQEKTGCQCVAEAIAALPKSLQPGAVFVHSLNPPGAKRIVATLQRAGIPAKQRSWLK